MDEEGRPEKLWARLLFQSRHVTETEFRLGLVVVGIALLLIFSVWISLVPQILANVALSIVNLMSWIGALFSGSNSTDVVAPVLTPGPTPLPSPVPSPSPFGSPAPFGSPPPFGSPAPFGSPPPFASPSPSPFPR